MNRVFASLILCLWASSVQAGGFEFPTNGTAALGRGGAFTARADDLSAIELNPAGLVKLKGTHIYLGNNFTKHTMEYSPLVTYELRSDADEYSKLYKPLPPEDWYHGKTVSNRGPVQILTPLVGVSTDFGLKDWRFALGVYGPSAYAKTSYEARQPQQYMLIKQDVLLAYYTASVAWQPAKNLGFGLSFHWVDLLQTRLSMAVSGYFYDSRIKSTFGQDEHMGYLDYQSIDAFDVTAHLDVADRFSFAATLGAWWCPIPNLEAGLSFRFPTIPLEATGKSELGFSGSEIAKMYQNGVDSQGKEGLVVFQDNGTSSASIPTTFKMALPPVARAGIRFVDYRTGKEEELWDIELDVVWEGWSVLENYIVELDGYVQVVGSGATDTQRWEFRNVVIPKKYRDTWSLRLGGQVNPLSWLEVRAGGYLETGSVPDSTTNLDFASFNRLGLALGFSVSYRFAKLSVSYSHVFQETRTVGADESVLYRQFPLLNRSPETVIEGYLDPLRVGAGRYVSSFDVVSVALSANF